MSIICEHDRLARFEDGPEIMPGCVGWYMKSCGMGSYEPVPIQNPTIEGPFLFWSGVGLRGSVYTQVINGRACDVFSTKDAMLAAIAAAKEAR